MLSIVDYMRGDVPAHLFVRELVNGLWFALSLAMCVEIGVQFCRKMRTVGFTSWRHDPGARVMAPLMLYFMGESLMRGWIWILLSLQNAESERVVSVQNDYYVAFVAAWLSSWAAACCLYVFAHNHWSWVRASIVITGCLLAGALLF